MESLQRKVWQSVLRCEEPLTLKEIESIFLKHRKSGSCLHKIKVCMIQRKARQQDGV